MTDQKVQTRVPDPMADDIETFQETGYMNKSEAVRRLLRDGLDANRPLDEEPNAGGTTADETTTDEEPEANDGQPDTTAIIERGYRLSKHLSDAGCAAAVIALGAWVAVTVTATPLDFGVIVATVTLVVLAGVLSTLGLALALGLRTAEAIAGIDADPQLRRLDLRRVVAS
jgi:Arc/MetJ-type ribon-helix-helix transcriptional regulator